MSTTRPRLLASVALLALAVVLAASCSSSDDGGGSAAEPTASSTTTEAPAVSAAPITSAPRQSCDAANLATAAAGPLPGAAFTDVVCESKFAVATWEASPDGPVIVLFTLQDGVWAYAASGPVSGDVAALAPADFSTTAIPEWLRKRQAAASRASSPGGGGGGSGGGAAPPATVYEIDPETGAVEACSPDGDNLICKPAPGIPPEAVTDPENAPPTTISMFCKYNYNDPRCVADNQFTP